MSATWRELERSRGARAPDALCRVDKAREIGRLGEVGPQEALEAGRVDRVAVVQLGVRRAGGEGIAAVSAGQREREGGESKGRVDAPA